MIIIVDIETTAIEPENGMILQFAAMQYKYKSRVQPHLKLNFNDCNTHLYGDAAAILMNMELIRSIKDGNWDCSISELSSKFVSWLKAGGWNGVEKLTIAGKNVAKFDVPWLQYHSDIFQEVSIHNRRLDVGNLYYKPATDLGVPDTTECLRRAGINKHSKHDALEDCYIVAELLDAA